jgi:hypothetical protein
MMLQCIIGYRTRIIGIDKEKTLPINRMTITQKAVDKGVNQKCNNNLDYKSNSFIMKVVVVHHNR